MGILDEDVARARDATDLVGLAGEHLALKRVGNRWVALCPFHSEKSASFSINRELGVYHCFGCQASGDAITFVREVEQLDFVGAVERLAARAGVTLRYDNPAASKDRQRRQRLTEATGAAIAFYHQLLLETPEGGKGRGYLRSRGFDGDAVRRFSLGWAPDTFDRLSVHLQHAGFTRAELTGAGLAFVNRVNKLQDQFRDRLLFPIYDTRGDPAGFGGRALDGPGPKYKNSPETPIYQKSGLLYGLNWAKGEIVARNGVVICEGYTDVMALALAGAPHAVATCGTALTDEHVRILSNLTRRVVLAYDADAAGQGAVERWYRWEHDHELDVRVAALPPGLDPADLFGEEPARLVAAVEGAKPLLGFRIERVLAAADPSTPEGRARAAEALVPVLREHPSELVREGYIETVAGRLGIEHGWFKAQLRPGERSPVRVRSAPGPARRSADQDQPARAEPPRVDRAELDALCWAVHEPDLVSEWLTAALFADPLARAVFDALYHGATFAEVLARAERADVRAVLQRLAVEDPIAVGEHGVVALQVVTNLIERAGRRLAQHLSGRDDERAHDVMRAVDGLHAARTRDADTAGLGAARTLVAWLAASDADERPQEDQRGAVSPV